MSNIYACLYLWHDLFGDWILVFVLSIHLRDLLYCLYFIIMLLDYQRTYVYLKYTANELKNFSFSKWHDLNCRCRTRISSMNANLYHLVLYTKNVLAMQTLVQAVQKGQEKTKESEDFSRMKLKCSYVSEGWVGKRLRMIPCSEAQTFVRKYCSSQGCI